MQVGLFKPGVDGKLHLHSKHTTADTDRTRTIGMRRITPPIDAEAGDVIVIIATDKTMLSVPFDARYERVSELFSWPGSD